MNVPHEYLPPELSAKQRLILWAIFRAHNAGAHYCSHERLISVLDLPHIGKPHLTHHVRVIRKHLRSAGAQFDIVSVHGDGYAARPVEGALSEYARILDVAKEAD